MRIVFRALVMMLCLLMLAVTIGLVVWDEVMADGPMSTEPFAQEELTAQLEVPANPPNATLPARR